MHGRISVHRRDFQDRIFVSERGNVDQVSQCSSGYAAHGLKGDGVVMSPKTQKAISKYAFECFEESVAYICKKYRLKGWTPTLIVDTSMQFTVCSGGFQYRNRSPFIILVFHNLEKRNSNGLRYMDEYDSFSKDPVIGSFETMNWKKVIAGYMMHELAHALHWTPGTGTKIRNALKLEAKIMKDKRPHGPLWKAIYRDLRVRFVNHLPDKNLAYS